MTTKDNSTLPELRTLLLDLYRKFASRSQYEGDGSITWGEKGLTNGNGLVIFMKETLRTYALICNMAGRAKAIVLPLPV